MAVCSEMLTERNACRGWGDDDESFDSEHAGSDEKK